jgi:hypothetical protein
VTAAQSKLDRRISCIGLLIKGLVVALSATSLLPISHTSAVHHRKIHHKKSNISRYTGYVISGRTSTFGWPSTGISTERTADGGSTERPCIAIRDDSTLDHWFEVEVNYLGRWHRAKLLHCDYGPAEWTGRAIDITGMGVEALGFSPYSYPTESWGVAKELR